MYKNIEDIDKVIGEFLYPDNLPKYITKREQIEKEYFCKKSKLNYENNIDNNGYV